MTAVGRYDDIMYLPHPTSKVHPRMPGANRAAQFAPFAALTGFEGLIAETGRVTEKQIFLSEDEEAAISERLSELLEVIEERPVVSLSYFERDGRKEGGNFREYEGVLHKIDTNERMLVFEDGSRIGFEYITRIN